MLKHQTVCAALIALTVGTANAQQREGFVRKLTIPEADFDVAVVAAKASGPLLDLRGQPDPLLAHVMGGDLVLAFDFDLQSVFPTVGSVLSPTCMLHVDGKKSRTPVAIYIVPKAD